MYSIQEVIKQFSFLKLSCILLTIGLFTSCSPKILDSITTPNDNDVNDEVMTKSEINVAFAGGGWRAHTGHSAWVMSLLSANSDDCPLSSSSGNPSCLQSAFTNVKTISGNSGGSWFSTMLMYDSDFINEITAKNAFESWGSTGPNQGWLGKQEQYFTRFNPTCGDETGTKYLKCILEHYYSSTDMPFPTPSWNRFVKDLVYKGYGPDTYGNLGDRNHQPWAKDKSLIMAGTLLTNSVVLNDQDDETYYQICLPPLEVKTNGDDGGWCSEPDGSTKSTPDVLPVSFTSLAENNPTLKPLPFISHERRLFNLTYTGAFLTEGPFLPNSIQSGINSTDIVPVVSAASASSAATGYLSSYHISDPNLPFECDAYGQWHCVYNLRNLAPGFIIPNTPGKVTAISDSELNNASLTDLKNARAIRIADGGAADNSGIAQLITFLQTNNQDDNFEIIAFDDVQINDSGDKNRYPSSDISYLFEGAPSKGVCVGDACVQVPPLAVLRLDLTSSQPITKHSWNVIGPNGETTDTLYYFIYKVRTIANANFNITEGSKGTIRVFASQFGCADTGPENNGDFACYKSMLTGIKNTLRLPPNNLTSTQTGYALLKEAFGLD